MRELSDLVGLAPVGLELHEDGWMVWCYSPAGMYSETNPKPQKNPEAAIVDAIVYYESVIVDRAHGSEG